MATNQLKRYQSKLILIQSRISTHMLLQFVLQLGDMGFSLLPRVVHFRVQGLASGGDESRVELILLAGCLLDLAELGGKGGKLVRLDGQSSLLGGFQLVLDRDLLRRALLRRRGCSLRHRRLSQDHLVAQPALGLLLASDLGCCKVSNGEM